VLPPHKPTDFILSCKQEEELEKMREICEKNQELLQENDMLKQVQTCCTDVARRSCLAVGLVDFCKAHFFFCPSQQKLLLLQVASGQKLRHIQQMPSESPDSSFDYIPPKVKILCASSHAVLYLGSSQKFMLAIDNLGFFLPSCFLHSSLFCFLK